MSGLTIFKSSAGSGKTFTLVKSYLQIVIRNPWDYRHVLAITFTNKATEEMKARIIGALSELASADPESLRKNAYYRDLDQYLKAEEPEKEYDIAAQARKVLNLILNDYSNFSVSTIESFFQRIVRAFTRELNIPLGFEIEMQQDLVLERIVDDVFLEIGRNQDLTRLLTGFVERNLDEERSWNIHLEIKKLADQVFKEKYQRLLVQYPEEDAQKIDRTLELVKTLQGLRAKFENFLRNKAQKALDLLAAHHLSPADFKYGEGGSIPLYFHRVLNKGDFDPKSRATNAILEDKNEWYTAKAERKDDIEGALQAGLKGILEEMVLFYEKQKAEYNSAIQVLRTLHTFGLLHDLQQKLAEYRREHNQLIISDTAYLIKEIINSQYDTPFIYEKVGSRYSYYLIDEFQDTSDMQWHNLLPLVLEALGQGKGGLLVGDVKQSIYRWRNGNMELLMRLVEAEIKSRNQQVEVEDLNKNWRTGAEIVRFNNAFFEQAADLMAAEFEGEMGYYIQQAYEGASQIPQRAFPAYVDVRLLGQDEEKDWKEEALEYCLDLIQKLKTEGFQGGEITFLVRRNQEGVLLAEYLQQHHQKVISAESLLVANHPKVILLLSFLQVLHDDQNPIFRASLAYYYQRLIEPETVIGHESFVHTRPFPPAFMGKMSQLRQLPVYECVERLLHYFPVLGEPNAYVQGFLDQVLRYSSTEDASISGFLEYWEDIRHKSAIASAPDPDAVQIMTIHKAKGLEFPVVVVPFANWDMGPSTRDFIWVEDLQAPAFVDFSFLPVPISSQLNNTHFAEAYEQEKLLSYLDNLNLLYVALTRPELRLYLLSVYDKQKDRNTKKRKLSRLDQLINAILDQEQIEGSYNQERTHFQYGKAVPRQEIQHKQIVASEEGITVLQANTRPHDNWNEAVKVRYSSNRYLPADILTRTERISIGELLHHALSFVEAAKDVPQAVDRMIGKGYLNPQQREALEDQLTQVVTNTAAANWYDGSWEVRNEAEIIQSRGNILRPDRVMIKGGRAIVVDYKTGQVSDRYPAQVQTYMQALRAMKYSQVEGYLYYLNLGLIEPVL